MEDYSNIIIGTSSYDNIRHGNLVSITGDGGKAWGFKGNSLKKLAPMLNTYKDYEKKLEILKLLKKDIITYGEYREQIEDEYIEAYYETRLRNIYVYDLLHELYKRFGNEIVLLCHEPVDEFCHRRLLADYIELETGMYIPEIKEDEEGNFIKVKPIRYKNRLNKIINKAY